MNNVNELKPIDSEFREAQAQETETHTFRRVSADYAHRHVRGGGIHNTPLWIDSEGRIRRARG